MLILLSASFLAGIFTKYLDFRAEKNKNDFYSWLLVLLSSSLIGYLVYIFPDVMLGVILAVAIAGKTSNIMQVFNVIIPFSVFAYAIFTGSPVSILLMSYVFLLAFIDELDLPDFKGVRPMLPSGMILLSALTLHPYAWLATITLLVFDLGYIIESKVLND